jgi:hypothetical protein
MMEHKWAFSLTFNGLLRSLTMKGSLMVLIPLGADKLNKRKEFKYIQSDKFGNKVKEGFTQRERKKGN